MQELQAKGQKLAAETDKIKTETELLPATHGVVHAVTHIDHGMIKALQFQRIVHREGFRVKKG